jgi:hypothetical protein
MRLRVISARLSVLACVIVVTACGGHGTGPGSTRLAGGLSATAARMPASTVALRAPWPERRTLPESSYVRSQVFDPGTDVLYTLASSTHAPANRPYVLQATDLRTGAMRQGQSYALDQLSLVSGYLWVSGWPAAGTPAVLGEVDPLTLRTVRSVTPSGVSWDSGVAPGPAGSVWVGAYQSLERISVASGAVLARTELPAGLGLSDMAASSGGAFLYVSAAHLVTGGAEGGAVLLEYSASTGELLAQTDHTPISYSLAGAALTALPAGVWVSFRTGSLGRSVLVSERALATVIAPVQGGTPESIYDWPMFSSSVYDGGALWVTTQTGLVACVDPATGRVRAAETVTSQSAQLGGLIVADSRTRQVFGFVANDGYSGLASISPPRSCWD